MELDKLQQQIDSIETRRKQLEAQKQKLEARLRTRKKTLDTRRKILIGALVLDRIEGNKPDTTIAEWVKRHLPGFLTRDGDKEIFQDIIAPVSDSKTTDENHEGGEGETSGNETTESETADGDAMK